MPRSVSLADYRRQARRRLPQFVFDFVDGGAGDETTLRANEDAFARVPLRTRTGVDVASRTTSTTVLDNSVSLPVLLAPTGLQRLVHRHADVEAARGAARAGTVYVASSASAFSIEEVTRGAGHSHVWFQLYAWRDRDVADRVIGRAADAGCSTLVVTVDVPVVGLRDRDLRNGMSIPPRITARNVFEGARHPRWTRHLLTGPPITFKNFEGLVPASRGMALMQYANEKLTNPATTWVELERMRRSWPGRFVVKGVLTAADARSALDIGADGVVVSNHGGRQLDGVPASLTALPAVVEAVGRDMEVLLDGGVRRGIDVLRALALGARAVMIGRPYWWGLAVDGERGVAAVLETLRRELDLALALTGVPRVQDVDRSVLWEHSAGAGLGTG
jgi:L-lactate dehydrogenase (cytochrome)